MALRKIREMGEECLRCKCKEITEVTPRILELIDDMIDTAGSANAGAKALKANGAKSVKIACSHGVFSGPAADRLLDGTFEQVVTTNSIPLPEKMGNFWPLINVIKPSIVEIPVSI